ncbi:MAG: hypothetical protein LBC30_00615 [Puniceicoccales bacterium]|nr:hypothetical protein [Puniceicoccales bacterium]
MKILRYFSYPKISDNSMLSKNESHSMVRMCCEFRKSQRLRMERRPNGSGASARPKHRQQTNLGGYGMLGEHPIPLDPRNILSIQHSFVHDHHSESCGLSRSSYGAKLVTFADTRTIPSLL